MTRLTAEREWERLFVSGGERLTEALAAALPLELREVTVIETRMLDSLSTAELATTITERISAAHTERELRLIRKIRETSLAAGAAAVRLSKLSPPSMTPAWRRSSTTRTFATTGVSATTGASTSKTRWGRASGASCTRLA
jgi:hypothetical protein